MGGRRLTTRATVDALLQACGPEPEWCWWAGRVGGARRFDCDQSRLPSMGVYNPCRQQAVQVLAATELRSMVGVIGKALIADLFHQQAVLVLLASAETPPTALVAAAEAEGVALISSVFDEQRLLTLLYRRMASLCAPCRSVHGVLMSVVGIGTLIVGAEGAGKSSLALRLLARGHRLAADDAVALSRDADGKLWGQGPIQGRRQEELSGYLFVRGLGLVDVVAEFGITAVVSGVRVEQLIRLVDAADVAGPGDVLDLQGEQGVETLLDVSLPCLWIRSAVGAVERVEACARRQLLAAGGRDVAANFSARHAAILTTTEGAR